jgi:MFS family permease
LAFDNPLRRSFVTEMVPQEDIPNAVVLYSIIVNGSRIFGPALAGLLVVSFGYGWCFTIDALSYFAVLVCIARMNEHELIRHPRKEKMSGEVREGFRYILDTPVLWVSFAMLAAIGTLAYNFNVTMPLFVTGALRSGEQTFTLLYSIFSAGAVASGLVIARRTTVGMKHVVWGAAALGVSMVVLGAVPSVSWAIPALFIVGVSSILYMTATTSIAQTQARRDMHGRVLALQMVFVAGTTLIGGPFSGWLADAVGTRAPIIFGGAVCLGVAVFGYVASRRYAL